MLFLAKWAKLSIFTNFLPILFSKLRVIRFCKSDYEGVRPTDNLEPAGIRTQHRIPTAPAKNF